MFCLIRPLDTLYTFARLCSTDSKHIQWYASYISPFGYSTNTLTTAIRRHSPTLYGTHQQTRKQYSILQFHTIWIRFYIDGNTHNHIHKRNDTINEFSCCCHLCCTQIFPKPFNIHTGPNTAVSMLFGGSVWFNQRMHSIQSNLCESEGVCCVVN